MPRKKTDLSQRLEAVIKTLVPQQEQNPDDLGPMMRAIKAVHSISDHTSTTPEDLERQRAGQELFARLVTPSIGIRNDSLTVGSIPAEWVSLEHGHDRHHAVLYCHGGGYTCGQLGYARILASKLALATGFDVLSFEYRLAPEHPFPAAIEDAVAMWDYLMYMGYGARDVIIAGDSAGGNLALELALKLKEQGRAQPRGLLLFSPWTDMTASGNARRELWVDGSSVRHKYTVQNADGTPSDAEYSEAEYQAAVQNYARAALKNHMSTRQLKCTAANTNLIYGTDYELGDLVPVRVEELGLNAVARVVSIRLIYESTGGSLRPVLDHFTFKE
mgnify:CR=1 FL=1